MMFVENGSNKLRVPEGFKDFLPDAAAKKRALEDKWIKLFKSWAYKEIVSSSFEYYDTLTMNVGVDTLSLLKTIDRGGHIIALRPDMTSPIARLVATRMKNYPLPQRLFYLANVFRYEDEIQRGRHREFYQAGVELIGPKGPKADGEIIALAVETLETAGLKNYQIGLGHVEITKGLLSQLNSGKYKEKEIREALSRKNFVKLHSLVKTNGRQDDEKIYKILTSQDTLDSMVSKLKEVANNAQLAKAVDDLEILSKTLKAFEVEQKVFVDFSILRDFNYYTGIVFEGYSEALGHPLCGGGRYDNLLGSFGYKCPATGFALGIERILEVLEKEAFETKPEVDYFVYGDDEEQVIKEVRRIRQEGYNVEMDLMNLNDEEAERYARRNGINNLLKIKQVGEVDDS